ncbi:MAG: hypothetical protein ABI321_04040 [Polyangia bacterium]
MRLLVLPLVLAACNGSGETAPTIALSIELADGRHCRDAAVTTVEIPLGGKGDLARVIDAICYEAEAPLSIAAVGLPLDEQVEVLGLSAEGATLYRGALKAADHLDSMAPAALVTLYAIEAR